MSRGVGAPEPDRPGWAYGTDVLSYLLLTLRIVSLCGRFQIAVKPRSFGQMFAPNLLPLIVPGIIPPASGLPPLCPSRREGAFVAVAGVCVLGEGAHRGCDFDMVQVSMERPDANFSTIYRLIAQGMPKSRREGAKA